jgi:hypothetical protein
MTGVGVIVGVAVGSGVYGAGVAVGRGVARTCITIGEVAVGVGRVVTCPHPARVNHTTTTGSIKIGRIRMVLMRKT